MLIISSNRTHKYCEFDNVKGYHIMFTEGFLCEYWSYNSDEVKKFFSDTYLKPRTKNTDLYSTIFDKLFNTIDYSYKILNKNMKYELIASSFKYLAQFVINIREMNEDSIIYYLVSQLIVT